LCALHNYVRRWPQYAKLEAEIGHRFRNDMSMDLLARLPSPPIGEALSLCDFPIDISNGAVRLPGYGAYFGRLPIG